MQMKNDHNGRQNFAVLSTERTHELKSDSGIGLLFTVL